MHAFRTRAVWLAALTLATQICLIASASAALCCSHENAATADSKPCCAHGSAGQACPMHKKANPDAPKMESCCDVDQQALAALFGFVAVIEAPMTTFPVHEFSLGAPLPSEQLIALVRPPDPPPPRS